MQLIDKAALIAIIKERLKHNSTKAKPDRNAYRSAYIAGKETEDEHILALINTLEVKEVDLENEYKNFVEEDPVYNKLVNDIVGKAIANHFFELGLKVQKVE